MALSEVDVANMALDHLKERAISSLIVDANSSPVVGICARWKDQSRRRFLRKHVWNAATKLALLARDTNEPVHTYDSQFLLPADYIRMGHIGEDPTLRPRYRIVGNKIMVNGYESTLSSDGSLPLTYIWNMTDPAKMDPLMVDVWALEWAIAMVGKITGTNVTKQELMEQLQRIAPEAYSIDGQDSPPIRVSRSRALAARRGFGTFGGGKYVGY